MAGLFGNGPGILGWQGNVGSAPEKGGWQDVLSILGATLQDMGAGYSGRTGYAVPIYQERMRRLGDQKKYQDTLAQLSDPGTASVTNPTFAPGQAPAPNLPQLGPNREILPRDITPPPLQVMDPGSLNAKPAGPLADPRFAQMLPILQGMDAERGLPLAFSALQKANEAQDPIKLGKNDRLFAPGQYDKPLVDAAPEPIDYNKPFMPDGTPNKAYQAYTLGNARAAAPNISLNTEKSYAGTIANELARSDAAVIDAARSAPQRIQSAQAVLRILDTQAPITGTGANARLMLDKALSTAGIVDGKNVVSTENLASELASQTLDAIKSSGLGSGQGFTDKDRQFLEKARAGNIELNAGTLHYLARKNEEAARASIRRGNAIAKRLKGDKNFGSVGQDLEIPEPPAYSVGIDDLAKKYLGK